MTEPVLKVQSLRKEFGGLVAVKDVSFEVGEGEFVGLIGPNGCGKSTTFNCISGLLEQTSGRIEMFGEDISELRPDQIQNRGMTRTFQHTNLWKKPMNTRLLWRLEDYQAADLYQIRGVWRSVSPVSQWI